MYFKMKLSVYLVFLCAQLGLKTDAALMPTKNYERDLLRYILANYSADIRPVQNHNDPINVTFSFMLQQIINLDVVNQILTVNIRLRTYWKDELITWDPNQFGGLRVINIEPSKLWLPDITVFNSATKNPSVSSLYKKIASKVVVSHTGKMAWYSPAIITTECKVDVRYFPFDTQICELEFGSWTYDGFRIDLQLSSPPIDTQKYSVSKEWHFHTCKAEKVVTIYSCCPEPYPSLKFHLVIKRRATFYVINLIIPCGIIALLSLFSFILPPNSGERVSFVITILLSLSVYMLLVTEKMPQSSDTPLASKFFMTMMVQIAMSLVVTCFIIKFHSSNTPIPWLFAKVVNQWLARLLMMKRKNDLQKPSESNADTKEVHKGYFNGASFLKDDGDLIISRVHDQRKMDNEKDLEKDPKKRSDTESPGQGELSKILDEVKFIADKLRDNDREDSIRAEWMFASEVLDRFFVCLLGSSIFLACVTIFIGTRESEILEKSLD